MDYSFDKIINRRNTGALKWDVGEDELPMWVADMDFRTAPSVIEAIKNKTEHGIFGYYDVTKKWSQAYINWWEKRHNFKIEESWITFCTGVVPAISSVVRKLTTPGENIVVQTPVYNIFFNSIVNNGRNPIESPLKYNGKSQKNSMESGNFYEMNFEDLEEKLANPQTSMMILCNPHNPTGNIWDKNTLERVGELCHKYNVIVVSDEIHCDITRPGSSYIPFASVSEKCRENSITCIAPTKAFNIAGMQTAAVVVPNKNLHHKVWRALNTDEVAEPNAFAIDVAIAAFEKGGEWLNSLREYLFSNRDFAQNFIQNNISDLRVVKADATYLMWVDCSKLTDDAEKYTDYLRKETGLYILPGKMYGKTGETFVRINLACPRIILEDGMNRLKKGTELFINTSEE